MLIPNLRIEDTIFEKGRGWYHDNLIGSDSLVITVGDSWTWGDDLTPNNDNEYRKQLVYGTQIAKKFKFDFLNF